MGRILVTEEIADSGLEELRAAGHDVDVQLGLYARGSARGRDRRATRSIIRSATQVTAEVLDGGTRA